MTAKGLEVNGAKFYIISRQNVPLQTAAAQAAWILSPCQERQHTRS
jgi:hypothetical protein